MWHVVSKVTWCTCGGGAQDYWLSSGDTEVPDPIPVAHVLLEQLAQIPGPCGGFKTGHNLNRKGREVGMMKKREMERGMSIPPGVKPNTVLLKLEAK